ncbi:hypothetical protein SAMN05421595_1386 [Austwickia chelonae]|nr:hypothetical protein SAMN05421595_1386 [Austwickia chelonae]
MHRHWLSVHDGRSLPGGRAHGGGASDRPEKDDPGRSQPAPETFLEVRSELGVSAARGALALVSRALPVGRACVLGRVGRWRQAPRRIRLGGNSACIDSVKCAGLCHSQETAKRRERAKAKILKQDPILSGHPSTLKAMPAENHMTRLKDPRRIHSCCRPSMPDMKSASPMRKAAIGISFIRLPRGKFWREVLSFVSDFLARLPVSSFRESMLLL